MRSYPAFVAPSGYIRVRRQKPGQESTSDHTLSLIDRHRETLTVSRLDTMQAELLSSASGRDALPIHSLHEDEFQDAEYQVLWNITMDQGEYNQSSAYDKVVVLLLCWAQDSNDLKTTEEVNALKLVLEKRFRYHTTTEYLDNDNKQRLQVQLNSKVAAFVGANDGPNTLLIVYYAGHGKPGKMPGDLEWFG